MEQENWVKVYKTTNAINAEIVKDMLMEQGIEAVVMNKIDSSFILGLASVYCRAEQEAEAQKFIQTNFQENE